MSSFSLELLGPFQAAVDQEPLTHFRTKKAQALLIYLAAEDARQRGAPVRRESLLALLWPDFSEQSARQSLRTNLSYLRHDLAPLEGDSQREDGPFILADHQTLQLNPTIPYELDVARFSQLLAKCAACAHENPTACQDCLQRLEQAAALYRGDFLCDFFLPDSAPFEEWAAARRRGWDRTVRPAARVRAA